MGYIEFKSLVKKVNLKPDGKQEIVLEVSDGSLRDKLNTLSEMIDCKAEISMDSMIVNYNIEVNARTDEPVKKYRVDDSGVVEEVKPEHKQEELDLGLPPEKVPTTEEKETIDRKVIDEFIREGLAPSYEDLEYNFESIMKRRHEGEAYMKMATELEMSSGKFIEVLDEYRKRVAPLAKAWDEWRENNSIVKEDKPEENKNEDTEVDEADNQDEEHNDDAA